jgi:integrase
VRGINKLSAIRVAKLTKPGRYGDGAGLWLQVSRWKNDVSKSWLFQYVSPTKRKIRKDGSEAGCVRQFGLGGFPRISLADARDEAAKAYKQVRGGIDPIETQRSIRAQLRLDAANRVTFQECADKYIASHREGWRNARHAQQWEVTLATYVAPVMGNLPVQKIDLPLVLKVLEPIWTSKPETAKRVRGRIEHILDFARARGYRDGENPARWKGHLDHMLAKTSKLKNVRHHPALPYAELPVLMNDLRSRQGISARALEFTILTAGRSGEVIGTQRNEIDLVAKLWTIPGERMKGGREHRVPLTDRMLEILKSLPREQDNPFVFIGGKEGVPLANEAMLDVLREMRPGMTVHGFRSTFRDWAAETTSFPNHVMEMALAHAIGDKVEASYRRGDLFEKRKRLMTEWAKYCAQQPLPTKTGNVRPLRAS